MKQFSMGDLESAILFEDRDILVLHKPAGIAVQHASFGQMDLESMLKTYLSAKSKGQGVPFLGIIHRLDQPVEGVLVFAKTKVAARELNRQLLNGEMKKYYLAVIDGVCEHDEGVLQDYLIKDGRLHYSRVAAKEEAGAKEARLKYHLLEQREGEALLQIELFTGRHHQIRVQMAHAGMPLVGDHKYHPNTTEGMVRLCAYDLKFRHPVTKKAMDIMLEKDQLQQCYQWQG